MGIYALVGDIEKILPKAVQSATTVTSAVMAFAIDQAEAIINARISGRYTVPVSGGCPILTSIAMDLAAYRILRRIFTREKPNKSDWVDVHREDAMYLLNSLTDGGMDLVNSAGTLIVERVDIKEPWSNTLDYHPTFHEGNIIDTVVSSDKILDIETERGI